MSLIGKMYLQVGSSSRRSMTNYFAFQSVQANTALHTVRQHIIKGIPISFQYAESNKKQQDARNLPSQQFASDTTAGNYTTAVASRFKREFYFKDNTGSMQKSQNWITNFDNKRVIYLPDGVFFFLTSPWTFLF